MNDKISVTHNHLSVTPHYYYFIHSISAINNITISSITTKDTEKCF